MTKSARLPAIIILAAMLTTSSAYAQMSPPPQKGPGDMPQEKNMMMGGTGAPANTGMPPQDPQSAADRKAEEELMFKNRKEEMLLRIKNRIAQMQKEQSCLDAAASMDALRSCGPGGMMMPRPNDPNNGMMMQKPNKGGDGMPHESADKVH